MKVLYLRSNPVNPDSRVEKQVVSLVKNGYNVDILAWDRSSEYKVKRTNTNIEGYNINIFRRGIKSTFGSGFSKNLLPLARFQVFLFWWLIKNLGTYDVVHAADFDTAFISFKICKLMNKKFVYDIFDFYVDSFSVPQFLRKAILKADGKIIKNADEVIICTEERYQQISFTTSTNISVIHNSPSIHMVNEHEHELNKSQKYKIVYVGILQSGRMLEELVQVVVENSSLLELHIGGFGLLEEYVFKASQNNDCIKYYGKLSYRDTIALEQKADIITAIYDPSVPNHKYAAPNKFYEAIMLGKPLVMVKNTGMSHLVEKHGIGVLIDYNKESLELGILELINNHKYWASISADMKELYTLNYSWDIMEKRLLKIYSRLNQS